MSERHRYLLRRRETVFAVENHAVAAIEHQHRRAGALILALIDVEVFVLQVQRNLNSLALHGGEECLADIQVERVPEFV